MVTSLIALTAALLIGVAVASDALFPVAGCWDQDATRSGHCVQWWGYQMADGAEPRHVAVGGANHMLYNGRQFNSLKPVVDFAPESQGRAVFATHTPCSGSLVWWLGDHSVHGRIGQASHLCADKEESFAKRPVDDYFSTPGELCTQHSLSAADNENCARLDHVEALDNVHHAQVLDISLSTLPRRCQAGSLVDVQLAWQLHAACDQDPLVSERFATVSVECGTHDLHFGIDSRARGQWAATRSATTSGVAVQPVAGGSADSLARAVAAVNGSDVVYVRVVAHAAGMTTVIQSALVRVCHRAHSQALLRGLDDVPAPGHLEVFAECTTRLDPLHGGDARGDMCRSWFGYRLSNAHGRREHRPVGAANTFVTTPFDRGQPVYFMPGEHRYAFSVLWNSSAEPTGPMLTWSADTTATASRRGPMCEVGCDGIRSSGKEHDVCGVCGGNGVSCSGRSPRDAPLEWCDGTAESDVHAVFGPSMRLPASVSSLGGDRVVSALSVAQPQRPGLGMPNAAFGGPGQGRGGAQTNTKSAAGVIAFHDASAGPGCMWIDFEDPVHLHEATVLNVAPFCDVKEKKPEEAPCALDSDCGAPGVRCVNGLCVAPEESALGTTDETMSAEQHAIMNGYASRGYTLSPTMQRCDGDDSDQGNGGECDDSDPCTIDVCVCQRCMHRRNKWCCDNDAQCPLSNDPCEEAVCNRDINRCDFELNDACCSVQYPCAPSGDPCLPNLCVDNQCQAIPVDNCCQVPQDCSRNGDGPCVEYACNNGMCSAAAIPGCCDADAKCDTPGECVAASCVNNTCVQESIVGCCSDVASCGPVKPCVDVQCMNATCMFAPIPGCCEGTNTSLCATAGACVDVQCANDTCVYASKPGCCTDDAACAIGDPCVVTGCVNQTCTYDAVDGCCVNDLQCAAVPPNRCVLAQCVNNTCAQEVVPGCCNSDAECVSDDPCVQSTCNATSGQCQLVRVPGCCAVVDDCEPGAGACVDVVCTNATCSYTARDQCCQDDAQCSVPNQCVAASCQRSTSTCVYDAVPECCLDDGDCISNDPCVIASCGPNATCLYVTFPGCCHVDSDCVSLVCGPCVQAECVPLGGGIGTCSFQSIVGCCRDASFCDDFNECTADTCVNTTCQYAPIQDCCRCDQECDDGQLCTRDQCVANVCINEPIERCCENSTQCPASPFQCAEYVCDPAVNKCVLDSFGTFCCTTNPQCEVFESSCIAGGCNGTSNECEFTPIVGCCTQDADCGVPSNPCLFGVCGANGTCSIQQVDCDDQDPCTDDACQAGVCVNVPKQCVDDGNPCTINTCASGLCISIVDTQQSGCCNFPGFDACEDRGPCVETQCVQNNCVYAPVAGGCCENVTQCESIIPQVPNCAQRACNNNQCVVIPDATCCYADADCAIVSPDPCAIAICINGSCVLARDPACCDTVADCRVFPDDACLDLANCTDGICNYESRIPCCSVSSDCDYLLDQVQSLDNASCYAAQCNATSGLCELVDLCPPCDYCNVTSDCQPQSLCTVADCQNGTCVYAPLDCDDGRNCTVDACASGVCVYDDSACPCEEIRILPPPTLTLRVTIRDFSESHPNFENGPPFGLDPGIVEPVLGPDRLPVFAGPTTSTTTQADFDQWYRDVPGVNFPLYLDIQLDRIAVSGSDPTVGLYEFMNNAFFPIDNQGFGNEGNPNNYHFTTEVHTDFIYESGAAFAFVGDDDVWVFLNGVLIVDLGGVHAATAIIVEFDDVANQTGLVPGEKACLDMFHAERNTVKSNFAFIIIEKLDACGIQSCGTFDVFNAPVTPGTTGGLALRDADGRGRGHARGHGPESREQIVAQSTDSSRPWVSAVATNVLAICETFGCWDRGQGRGRSLLWSDSFATSMRTPSLWIPTALPITESKTRLQSDPGWSVELRSWLAIYAPGSMTPLRREQVPAAAANNGVATVELGADNVARLELCTCSGDGGIVSADYLHAGSNAVYDRCGVCGGDGSSCHYAPLDSVHLSTQLGTEPLTVRPLRVDDDDAYEVCYYHARNQWDGPDYRGQAVRIGFEEHRECSTAHGGEAGSCDSLGTWSRDDDWCAHWMAGPVTTTGNQWQYEPLGTEATAAQCQGDALFSCPIGDGAAGYRVCRNLTLGDMLSCRLRDGESQALATHLLDNHHIAYTGAIYASELVPVECDNRALCERLMHQAVRRVRIETGATGTLRVDFDSDNVRLDSSVSGVTCSGDNEVRVHFATTVRAPNARSVSIGTPQPEDYAGDRVDRAVVTAAGVEDPVANARRANPCVGATTSGTDAVCTQHWVVRLASPDQSVRLVAAVTVDDHAMTRAPVVLGMTAAVPCQSLRMMTTGVRNNEARLADGGLVLYRDAQHSRAYVSDLVGSSSGNSFRDGDTIYGRVHAAMPSLDGSGDYTIVLDEFHVCYAYPDAQQHHAAFVPYDAQHPRATGCMSPGEWIVSTLWQRGGRTADGERLGAHFFAGASAIDFEFEAAASTTAVPIYIDARWHFHWHEQASVTKFAADRLSQHRAAALAAGRSADDFGEPLSGMHAVLTPREMHETRRLPTTQRNRIRAAMLVRTTLQTGLSADGLRAIWNGTARVHTDMVTRQYGAYDDDVWYAAGHGYYQTSCAHGQRADNQWATPLTKSACDECPECGDHDDDMWYPCVWPGCWGGCWPYWCGDHDDDHHHHHYWWLVLIPLALLLLWAALLPWWTPRPPRQLTQTTVATVGPGGATVTTLATR